MIAPTTPRGLRLAVASLLSVLLAAATVMTSSLPAAAHDELVSTDPVADTTVSALPARLVLSFSADLLTAPDATVVRVTDAGGGVLSTSPPVVDGAAVTQTLSGTARGAVTVLWRVASSDGHPISGQFTFSIAEPAPPATPGPTATPSPTPSSSLPVASAAASPAPSPATAPNDAGNALPWLIGAVVAIAILVAATAVLVTRTRRREALGRGPRADPGGGADR